MFDEYAVGFSACGNLNEVMHDKTWPYWYLSHKQAGNDYLFTSGLINFYHIWLDADKNPGNVSFVKFYIILAVEIVKAKGA